MESVPFPVFVTVITILIGISSFGLRAILSSLKENISEVLQAVKAQGNTLSEHRLKIALMDQSIVTQATQVARVDNNYSKLEKSLDVAHARIRSIEGKNAASDTD